MSEPVRNIVVDVESFYLPQESDPARQRFVFGYRVAIRNQWDYSIQLLARYWRISQGSGDVREIGGEGVVGKQPMIAPGLPFNYSSRAILDSEVGVMEGSYTVMAPALGRTFDVAIAPFRLACPLHLH
ncbi:ApaG protein [Kushneria avicenniae]|uniref:ApaG protein n=1 Tax=Kushneria avicenniae TaxID=402385 RepID=A0A1I1KEV5_9GAMM|nr:Co2+/Mg2+ efflux protein ApaG [Kushneria avicenniae]SFC59494.1 ApaG protein [Kushneria avicenniae]